MRAALTVIVTAAILAGCGSAPPLQTTAEARRDRQLDLSDNGRRAVARGDLRRAAVHYREALRLAEETEDFRGIAVNTLNLAAIWQALGERERAQQALDRITDSPARFDNRFVADAAGRQAQLALLAERLDAAEQWLARAEGICQAPSCQSRTALINLRGQLSLARGSTEEARNLAARALAASRAEGNREEEANALRLDGRAVERSGDPAAAVERLERALDIDKNLALPQKVAQDLLALSEVELARGNGTAAGDYAKRALDVSRASGNKPQQDAAARLLERAR